MTIDLIDYAAASRTNRLDRERLIDLKADELVNRMANGDAHILEVCGNVLSAPLLSVSEILRRQDILSDLFQRRDWLEGAYACARTAVLTARMSTDTGRRPWIERVVPSGKKILAEIDQMRCFAGCFRELAGRTREETFHAAPLIRLAEHLQENLSDAYLDDVQALLQELDSLRTEAGDTISMRLGDGLKWQDAVVNGIIKTEPRRGLWKRGNTKDDIELENIAIAQNAAELVDVSLRPIFVTLQAVNRAMERFCVDLYDQLGFFVGCVRLYHALRSIGAPVAFPVFTQNGEHRADMLMDVYLVVKENSLCTANTIDLTGKALTIVTGRNQGGKTTFLRSIGLAQLMAQSGLFVAAQSYACPCYNGVFAHFPGGEDERLTSGLLDAELKKLSEIVDCLTDGSLLLLNETFQTTTDDAACELAEETVLPICGEGVKVVFVTHLYAYAHALWLEKRDDILLLSPYKDATAADRYRLRKAEPSASAYGTELYKEFMSQES